ncbi:transcription factor HHO5-like [Chenopodium quinoa]|uniref:transcription factor HHO5-like n=1 Tax=Chenopodium quinoa TaxID=63459 RepID=UPI000B771BCE|nr:transcription factor HHO5-like [Chenopodium quinoa]
MASNFPQLSLSLPNPPEVLTRFLVAGISDLGELSKLNGFIICLEDELKKIQAFHRELPLSSIIVNDAISKLKEVAKKNEEKQFEKKTWMSSAQLWSSTTVGGGDYEPHKNEGKGAVLSFEKKVREDVTGLSLVPPGLNTSLEMVEPGPAKLRTGGIFSGSVFAKPAIKPSYQTTRKRRRCWSPELHRRFVDALESLGGAQVATPKQIKELMKVDGLTNDEVKSHLQKYRLHVRKLPAASKTNQLTTDLGMDYGDQLELGCLTTDLQHSGSPKGPLHLGESRKCNSSSFEEDEEEKSDGQS